MHLLPDNESNPAAVRHKAVDCMSLPTSEWTAVFSTPTMQAVAAWNLGVHRQAAAGEQPGHHQRRPATTVSEDRPV